MTEATHFINGLWFSGKGKQFTSLNPATNTPIWQGKSCSETQVADAINSARHALNKWCLMPIENRIHIIEHFTKLLSEKKEMLAVTISQETGKPLWESRTEISAMIGKTAISIKAYFERTGNTSNVIAGAQSHLRHKPHGVVAVYGPYNFPAHLPNGHIIPALIAGNTVVFKPSELTPWVAEEIVKLWQLAGIPKGVLNLVQGEKNTGKALSEHIGIDGLFFTGSSSTGHLLH